MTLIYVGMYPRCTPVGETLRLLADAAELADFRCANESPDLSDGLDSGNRNISISHDDAQVAVHEYMEKYVNNRNSLPVRCGIGHQSVYGLRINPLTMSVYRILACEL